jgi:hypothetical protein
MLKFWQAGLLALVLCSGVPAVAQLSVPVAFERLDTLNVGGERYYFARRIQQLAATSQRPLEETVEWWEIRDAKANTLFRRKYPVVARRSGFESTIDVQATAINTALGKGIMLRGEVLPSAPGAGSWVQIFGRQLGNDEGKLVPFGPPISTQGELIDITVDPRRPTPPSSGATLLVMNDILRFRVWTGNLSIIYPVLINWITGKLEPSWQCRRSTLREYLDRCSYPIEVQAHRESQMTFIRLFREPDESAIPKRVVLKPESDVEYLEAEVPVVWNETGNETSFGVPNQDEVWLKIRIDGQVGWIHSEEDLEAVGLPQAG